MPVDTPREDDHNEPPMFGFPTGLVLGKSGPWSIFPSVTLSESQRVGHVYVVGKTGKGKSKLLQHCLYQDIVQGRGCGVIDPHGDLIRDLLGQLHRRGALDPQLEKRIVYLDPAQHQSVVPFNVLAASGHPYETAQNVIEALRRTWPRSLTEAPHFSNLMLHSLLLLIQVSLPLTALPKLLTDKAYRERLLHKADERDLTAFFHGRFDAWGKSGQAAIMRESSLNKITALTLNPHLRRMLGQAENHLNFRTLMDEGRVLLVDLGSCDEESRRLMGSLITTGIEQAVMTRQAMPVDKRRPFYLYVDEFQDFSSQDGSVKSLARILVSARKFGLVLTLAHQYLGQLSRTMQDAILGNVWTKIVFGVSEADAQLLAQWMSLGNIDPQQVKHEAPMGAPHPLYTPLLEQWNAWAAFLANQRPRQAVVRDPRGHSKQLWTVALKDPPVDEATLAQIKSRLLRHSGAALSHRHDPIDPILDDQEADWDWPEYDGTRKNQAA